VSCHAGWRLTDDSLHTSGGSTIRTPSLREVAWTAPYGMDGATPTLAGFLQRHRGAATLSAAERERLVAFLRAVSNDKAPREAGAAAR
jgi:cytochrome c peroxidase